MTKNNKESHVEENAYVCSIRCIRNQAKPVSNELYKFPDVKLMCDV